MEQGDRDRLTRLEEQLKAVEKENAELKSTLNQVSEVAHRADRRIAQAIGFISAITGCGMLAGWVISNIKDIRLLLWGR